MFEIHLYRTSPILKVDLMEFCVFFWSGILCFNAEVTSSEFHNLLFLSIFFFVLCVFFYRFFEYPSSLLLLLLFSNVLIESE